MLNNLLAPQEEDACHCDNFADAFIDDMQNKLISFFEKFYERSESNDQKESIINEVLRVACSGDIAEKTSVLCDLHYDMPALFFVGFLDEIYNAYSCAIYNNFSIPSNIDYINKSISRAQTDKFALIAERAKLDDGMAILNIGSGFGSLEQYLTSNYSNLSIVSLNPSKSQQGFAKERLRGVQGINGNSVQFFDGSVQEFIVTGDAGEYDRIISIGMAEHVKNVKKYFENISTLLAQDGYIFHHLICSKKPIPKFVSDKSTGVRKYFPGGRIWPMAVFEDSLSLSASFSNSWYVNGMNYYYTLDAWQRKFLKNNANMDLPEEEFQFWSEYFIWCKALFFPQQGEFVGVGHFLHQKQSHINNRTNL